MNGTQVRNLFYVKEVATLTENSAPGTLEVVYPVKTELSGHKIVQLRYVNPDKKVITSDFIVLDQAKVKKVDGKATPLKKAVLQLIDAPVAGEDYIVDLYVRNYLTLDDNSVLAKFAAAHATTGATKKSLLFTLAKSFVLNFRRDADLNAFFKFYLANVDALGNTSDEVEIKMTTKDSDVSAIDDNDVALVIEEQEQKTWIRGMFPKQTVSFEVAPHTIISEGGEVQPFKTKDDTGLVELVDSSTTIKNGYDMADLEYLCHGEIGDQLREVNYPRNIRTKYMIEDVDKMYDTIEIYFYYVGRNTSPEKSEKQITLVFDQAGGLATTVMTTLATYIK